MNRPRPLLLGEVSIISPTIKKIEDFDSYLLRDIRLLTKLMKIYVISINYFDKVIK